MAMKPKKAAPPQATNDEDEGMDAQDGNQGTDDEEDEPSDEGEEGEGKEDGSEVIATILKNEDGTYTLIHGDEDEGEDEGEGAGGEEDEDEEGEEGEEGKGEEGEEPKRETFQTEGELLKGVLDCIRAESGHDEGAADHEFEGGFSEEQEPMPAAAAGGRRSAY